MGNKLFSEVTNLTGLPEELIGEELKTLLSNKGVSPELVTMESLREALANYLTEIHESINAEAKAEEAAELMACTVDVNSGFPTQ